MPAVSKECPAGKSDLVLRRQDTDLECTNNLLTIMRPGKIHLPRRILDSDRTIAFASNDTTFGCCSVQSIRTNTPESPLEIKWEAAKLTLTRAHIPRCEIGGLHEVITVRRTLAQASAQSPHPALARFGREPSTEISHPHNRRPRRQSESESAMPDRATGIITGNLLSATVVQEWSC